ncbi:MAG: membrane protein insertion efficiency factor YidD [Bacteroidota bacterium]|nr:membrane protein insertion efficiency factor YidD [Bacteroidota bacterium]
MRLVWLFIFYVASHTIFSQVKSDFDLLLNTKIEDSTYLKTRQVNYVFKDKNWFTKYNPLSLVFGGSLLFYQKFISPQIMAGCAFDPSCSNFSKQCIKIYGMPKGVALSADRLTRCTLLSSIDFHPVLINENGKVNDLPIYYRLREKK